MSLIKHGNMLTLIQELGDKSIDHFISDVPYITISGGTPDDPRRPSGILASNNGKIFAENNINIEDWLPQIVRVVKDGGNIVIFTNFLNLFRFIGAVEANDLSFNQLFLWKKNNVTPNRWYMKQGEYIISATKGKPHIFNEKILSYKNVRKREHPTQKPINLMEKLILLHSKENDIILDPFCGSGSTLLAAKNLNRGYIGFELDEDYYNLALKNLNN